MTDAILKKLSEFTQYEIGCGKPNCTCDRDLCHIQKIKLAQTLKIAVDVLQYNRERLEKKHNIKNSDFHNSLEQIAEILGAE